MGRRSREKRERKEEGRVVFGRKGQEIRPVFILKGIILFATFLILFTPLLGPPFTNGFFFPFVGPKSLYFMALAEIVFFSWLILLAVDKRFRPKFNLISLGLFLFIAVSLISAITGIDPAFSFWSKFERMSGILMLFHLFAFFLAISSTFEKKDWQKIFAVSILVGVIIGIISLSFKNPITRGGATIGNDSFLGTYLLFNLFFALYLFFSSKNELKAYSSACLTITSFILLLSGARAAKFSFLGGLILLFFLWLAFSQRKKIRTIGVSLLAISLTSAIVFAFSAFQPESFVRKGIVERSIGATFGGRFIVWQKGWESFLQRPLLGWGPENFEFAFTKDYNSCMGTERCGSDMWYDRAHNIIFDTLVSVGALGMISYILIFLFIFYFLWKNYLRKKSDFWLAGIFSVLLISYSIQNLTVFDMVSSYMVFFLTLGFIAMKEIPETEERTVNSSLLFYASLISVFLFSAALLKFVIMPLQADAYAISALQSKPFSEQKLSFYQKTLSVTPVGRYQIREFFVDSSLGSLSESENIPKEREMREFDFLEQELRKSIEENKINYRAYLKLGQLLNVYGRIEPSKLDEAEKVLNKAIEISPTNQQGYWYLAQTKIQQGKMNEALPLAEKAVELEPNLERSHIIAIKIAGWMGDSELVEKKIKEALAINPSWEKDIKDLFKNP